MVIRAIFCGLLAAFILSNAGADALDDARTAREEARKARVEALKVAEAARRERENNRRDVERDARKAESEKNYDQAIALFERIITDFPPGAHCYSAQRGIAINLARKGDYPAALQAARLAATVAPSSAEFDDSVQLCARIMSAMDNSVDRANQLLAWQKSPKSGTPNPLDAIGYPAMPAREEAMLHFRQEAGDGREGSALRAYTYLLLGQTREALAQFADGFRRSYEINDWQRATEDLIRGLRASSGHRGNEESNLRFLIHGAAGPDGKPGTGDDLVNPFKDLLPPPPAPLSGGLAMMSPEQIGALTTIYESAMLYANDPWLRSEWRRNALYALVRATSALDGWGSPAVAGWLPGRGFGGQDVGYNVASTTMARMAARGGALDFGGVPAIWPKLEQICAAAGVDVPKQVREQRETFERMSAALTKSPPRPLDFKPLDKPQTNF